MSGKPKEIREAIVKMFDKVIYAKTKAQFDINLEAVMKSGGSKVKEFLSELLPEHYAQAFFPGARYGELTSNAAESLNNKFVSERQLPIIGLVDGVRKSIMTDMTFQRDLSSRWVFKICPDYDKLLIDKIGIAKQWTVFKSSNDLYEVSANKLVSVNLAARTCSCLSWQLDLFPCAHAVAAILESQRPIELFVDRYFHTETFRQTYVVPVNPISTIYLEESSLPTLQVLPPTLKAQPGRPKSKRKRSTSENRRESRCTLCRKKGHNQRSCSATKE